MPRGDGGEWKQSHSSKATSRLPSFLSACQTDNPLVQQNPRLRMDSYIYGRKLSRKFSLVPADIWFEVIDGLAVRDILNLRAVNKNFYRIVSSPVVWKRVLRSIDVSLPFQPAPIANLSAKAVENLIRRAIRVDENWHRAQPSAITRTLDSVERPYMVRFLPGGRWLVAATRSNDDQSYAVVVWDMENPEERGGNCALLAKCRTRTEISQLCVRFMVHKGKQGIAIATLRPIGDKPSTKTEVCVIHISLESLERLSAFQKIDADPFQLVELHKTRCQISYISMEGTILSLTHRPRTLMFVNLATKKSSQLKLPNPIECTRHSVWGCKVLCCLTKVLVIRLIYADGYQYNTFEIYQIPPWGEVAKDVPPLQRQVFEENDIHSFTISEFTTLQPTSDRPTAREMRESCHYAAPISIFAHTVRPRGIIHFQIKPKMVPVPSTDPDDDMSGLDSEAQILTHPQSNLPGMYGAHNVPGVIGQNPSFPQPPPPPPPTLPPNMLPTFQLLPGAAPQFPFPGIPLTAGSFQTPFGAGPGAPAVIGGGFADPLGGFAAAAAAAQVQAQLQAATQNALLAPPGMPGGALQNGQPGPPIVPMPPAPLPDTDIAMMEEVDELSFGALEPQYILPAIRVAHYIFEENDQKPTILAGSDRSVFWTRPLETRADHPPMRNLLGYTSKINHTQSNYATANGIAAPITISDSQEEWGLEAQSTQAAQGEENLRDGRLKQLRLPPDFVTCVQVGTQNVTFDESSCKLCIVADKPTRLFVLDYAV